MQRVMSRNGYSYVEGNPVNYADPSGRIAPLLAVLGFGLVGAGIGAVTGFFAGADYGYMIYDLAASGQCGTCAQNAVSHQDRTLYAVGYGVQGALAGGVIGFTGFLGAAVGGVPGAAIAGGVSGAVLLLSGKTLLEAGASVATAWRSGNTASACDIVNAILGIAGVYAGARGVVNSFNEFQAQRGTQVQSEEDARVDLSQRRTWNSDYVSPRLRYNADRSGYIDSPETIRVGRWMSPEEYSNMLSTGRVQAGDGSYRSILFDGPDGYRAQAKPGSYYVEFDLPPHSPMQITQDMPQVWGRVLGPNTLFGRGWSTRTGRSIVEMPPAYNISHIETK